MGQVYRATDTRLKRQVAIKILPVSFGADPDRLARFQREAEVLASLSHPNIAGIHGVEESLSTSPGQAAITALVMELVEGEDLSERLARGAMPLDEALPVARQIADALEAAHEQGIVHRDVKPANIKLRADGTVKVLDFGLAKATEPAGAAGATAMNSPTLSLHATLQGVVLGTAAYMAPEQARGRPVDKRADVWAYGVVLYEMLTGVRAFAGDDISITLASVLKDDIRWEALPAGTPPRLRRLLERCLERDVKQRLRDIGEARIEISRIESGVGEPPSNAAPAAPARRSLGALVPWAVAGVAVAAALAMALLRPASATDGARVVRLPLAPDSSALTEVSSTVVSPDGQKLLFSARGKDGRQMLWLRPLDALEAQPLPDTDDAIEPFWSPDSRSIAFGAQGKLKRLDLGSTRAQPLSDAARSNSGAWSPSGVIVFSPDYRTTLVRVTSDGRDRAPATAPIGGNADHRYPVFLPDGRHFLWGGGRGMLGGALDSSDAKPVLPGFGPAVYAPPGWLLYIRNGAVVAHRFDAARLELSGEPIPVATPPGGAGWARGDRLSVSTNGVLVIQRNDTYDYRLAWFDRSGKPAGALAAPRTTTVQELPRISPDGTRVLVQRRDPQTSNQDLWIGDLARGTFDRFTTDPAFEQTAIWSVDGRRVFCSTARDRVGGIYAIPVGGGRDELLLEGTAFPSDRSPDGKWLLYLQRGERTRLDVWALPLTGTNRAPRPLVNSEFDEQAPHISPDGRWIAYSSDVTGTTEVYVRRFTDGTVGEATRVSTGGGMQARWSHDGRELFFVSAPHGPLDAQMMAVPVTTSGATLAFGAAVPLFRMSMLPGGLGHNADYDVSRDGRFLVGAATSDARTSAATLVLNWPAALKP